MRLSPAVLFPLWLASARPAGITDPGYNPIVISENGPLSGICCGVRAQGTIARLTNQDDFPAKPKSIQDCYTREIEELVKAAGLTLATNTDASNDPAWKPTGELSKTGLKRAATNARLWPSARTHCGDYGCRPPGTPMDQITLVEHQIDDVSRLTDSLMRANFDVKAAFWLDKAEADQWFLSPGLRRRRPKGRYRSI